MKKRSFIIFSFLLAVLLTFSGCGGGNSLGGGHISFISDSNPFVGTWINKTTEVTNSNTEYHYEKLEITTSNFTQHYVHFENYGVSGTGPGCQYCVDQSINGTWYFLVDGAHFYIKPTQYGSVYLNPEENVADNITGVNATRAQFQNQMTSLATLNTEAHYIYTFNDAKTEFYLRLPTDAAGTVRVTYRRY